MSPTRPHGAASGATKEAGPGVGASPGPSSVAAEEVLLPSTVQLVAQMLREADAAKGEPSCEWKAVNYLYLILELRSRIWIPRGGRMRLALCKPFRIM